MPWNAGWSSGKPSRPPPVAGLAQTGRRRSSASAVAAAWPRSESSSGPATSTGERASAMVAASALTSVRGRAGAPGHRPPELMRRGHRVHLGVPVVHRDRHEHRAARRQRGEVRSARERVRHVLGPRRLVAPLDERVRHPGGVAVGQVRLQGHERARLLAGGHEQRRLVGLRVEDRAHPVAHARRGVQVHERRTAARLGEAVGHPDRHRLVEPQHVAEVIREVGQHRQLGGARVAEHRGHPLPAQEVEGRFAHARHQRAAAFHSRAGS